MTDTDRLAALLEDVLREPDHVQCEANGPSAVAECLAARLAAQGVTVGPSPADVYTTWQGWCGHLWKYRGEPNNCPVCSEMVGLRLYAEQEHQRVTTQPAEEPDALEATQMTIDNEADDRGSAADHGSDDPRTYRV